MVTGSLPRVRYRGAGVTVRGSVSCMACRRGSTLSLEYQKRDPHKERDQNEAAIDHVPKE